MRNHILSSAIALTAALSTPALARPMTEVDLATLKRVAAPTASPDGRWVVFQMTETDADTYKRSTGLWLVDRNAKNAKPAPIADTAGKNETSPAFRSEEHTSELQSLMRSSYAVFCFKNTKPIR